jgi:tRNA(Arg) A34 adenosine deaminase TadA
MKLALEEARKSFERNEVPIGAVIIDTKTNSVIAASGNHMEELLDPTAHAEINVIRQACIITKSGRLPDCVLYVTFEPCPMCAQAISFARIRRVYFGAYDAKGGGVEHGAKIFSASSCHHKPDVYGGIMEQESFLMLKDFFKSKR